MHWRLSDEQEAYRKALRSWLDDTASSSRVREWLANGLGAVFHERLVGDGWSGVGVPEEFGGQGGDVLELALTAEELGRTSAPSSAWLATALAVVALRSRPDLAAKALSGAGGTIALPAELPAADAPTLAMDAAGRVTGTVPRVLGAAEVDYLLVPVRAGGERRIAVVPSSQSGITLRTHELLDRSRTVADLTFDGVTGDLLDVDASEVLDAVTDVAGVLIAADALGAAERMLELAVTYSGQRHQFGVPIGSFQAVKHAAATIEVGVESIRSAVYYAAASLAAGHPERSMHAAAVKAQAGEMAAQAADSALTLHGAIGYTWEHDLQLFYKRAKLDAVLFGSAEVWNERIAAALQLA